MASCVKLEANQPGESNKMYINEIDISNKG
jgi:hypothetical protein